MAIHGNRLGLPSERLIQEVALIGTLLLVFAGLLGIVVQWAPTGFDRALYRELRAIPWGAFGFVPQFSSDLGGGLYGMYLLPAALAAVAVLTKRWRLLALVAAVFVLHLVLISPKLFVEAYRPSPAFGVQGGGGLSSFPSGHVQWAVSFYGLLAFLSWRHVERLLPRVGVAAGYSSIVVLTMLSRIDLGRHWPIDTLAGLLAGLVAVRVLMLLHDWSGTSIPRLQSSPRSRSR